MADRFMLVATVKDEALNLLEWVAYHQMIGFTDIVVYQNDSTDLTERCLKIMEQIGAISYFPNNFRPGHPNPPFQNRAYRRASRLPLYRDCDWCMALDADEFLLIRTAERNLASLVASCPGADEIRINWRVFGSSGLRELDERLQTERFTHAVHRDVVLGYTVPVKTLFRTDAYERPGIHIPKEEQRDDIKTVTGSGVPLDQVDIRKFMNTDLKPYGLAQVNHYMLRDSESFLIKSARGSSSNTHRTIRSTYWKKRNHNQQQETEITALLPALRERMAALDAASGGRLSRIRSRSLRQWRARARELRADPDYAGLYDKLV